MEELKKKIRNVPDFPKPGINFFDITTLLRDKIGFSKAVECLSKPYENEVVDQIIGIESRGFIFGGAVADRLRTGFVPVRKVGKLPSSTVSVTYDLEYGTDSLEIHKDALEPGQNVVIVDDLLATGGTARATIDLINKVGGNVLGLSFLIELTELHGLRKLKDQAVLSVLKY